MNFPERLHESLYTNAARYIYEETHKYSSTQINLPKQLADRIQKWAKDNIDPEDINQDEGGLETETHITCLYGLHDDKPDQVKELLQDQSPIAITIGKTSAFTNDGYDVLKLTVASPALHSLHDKLKEHCEHTDTHPEYKPHCTIAYLKPGTGDKYVDDNAFQGEEFEATELVFSNKEHVKTTIPFVLPDC